MINIYIAKPLVGVNDITFGMERSAVREKLGSYQEFSKDLQGNNNADDFGGIYVYYDAENRCEAIEIFDGIVTTEHNEVLFPGIDADAVKNIFPDLTEEYGSWYSAEKSVGISFGGTDDSIVFGKPGYYSKH